MAITWRDLTEQHLATATQRTVLLVEDDTLYVERIRQTLLATSPRRFSLEVSRTLAHAEQAMASKRFDLVLLDLGLPDASGLQTFERMHRAARGRPIVVVTSADDPDMAARLLYLGAQDYLVKGASEDLLLHVIGRAISRSAPDAGRSPILEVPEDPGKPLREQDPQAFDALVEQYRVAVGAAARRRILRDPEMPHRDQLRVIAKQLGRAGLGARDALEVHAAAVRLVLSTGAPDLDSWINESRLVALELLSGVLEHYRALAVPQEAVRGHHDAT